MGHIYVRAKCPSCGKYQSIEVTMEEYEEYTRARRIPTRLSLSEREALISGFCDKCWDDLFKEMDDE